MKTASNALMMTCLPETAEEFASILYGCYRRTDADSPEIFLSAAVAVLAGYPEAIVRAVCDPRSGLPEKSKFPPNIYELTQACDERMRPLLEADRRRRIAAENETDRPAEIDPEDAARRRAVIAAWRERQATREAAAAAGVETPLEALDARKLQGEHREIVKQALDAKIKRLAEESRATPVTLSAAAMATRAGRAPVPARAEAAE